MQNLSLSAPDALDETVTLGQSVQGVVGLAHGADEAAEGVDVVLAGDSAAVLVDLGNGDLDRAVVLGLDDAVGSAALARDVAGSTISISTFLQQSCVKSPYRSTMSPRSFSISAVWEGGSGDDRGVVWRKKCCREPFGGIQRKFA